MANSNLAGPKKTLYFDELHVRQRFTSGTYLIDEEQIKAFAKQFDPQPFHLDAEAAKGTLFEGLVASGWHTAAITMRLLVEGGMPIAGGVIGADAEVSWPRPTRPGAILRVESEVLELKEDFDNPSGGLGARLLAPIYQGGALKAKVEIRTLQQKEAIADYARVALRALSDVENALAASSSLAIRAALLADAVREQTRALDLTETSFRVGRADRRAVEQQRLSVQNARMALYNVRTDELAGRVNLYLALGGNFAGNA